MLKLLLFFTVLFFQSQSYAEEVYRIRIGKDYKKYSQSDLQRRVWELEKAVWQLQRRIYQLESEPAVQDTWLCTLEALGNSYSESGPSKAIATTRVIDKCKKGQKGDGFFCKSPKCEQ